MKWILILTLILIFSCSNEDASIINDKGENIVINSYQESVVDSQGLKSQLDVNEGELVDRDNDIAKGETVFNDRLIQIFLAEYIEMIVNSGVLSAKNNIHPNLSMPGNDFPGFFIITDDYKILSINYEMLDIDLVEPKIEKIAIVNVRFNDSIVLHGDDLQILSQGDMEISFFISLSTGSYKIIDYTPGSIWKMVITRKELFEMQESSTTSSALSEKIAKFLKENE